MLFVLCTTIHNSCNDREHDKGPEEFCCLLTKMVDANLEFVVSILGEHTTDIPGKIIE